MNHLSQQNGCHFKPLIIGLIMLSGCVHSFGQSIIAGRVINNSDKSPVANASIFLSNTTTGGETKHDGTFALHNVKQGKYELIVSIVGFETYRQTLILNNSDIKLPDIAISPKVIALKEVSIKPGSDPLRERNFSWFIDEFLGTSALAKDCKILNPEVIDLDYDDSKKTLTASSVNFIVIENNALGYKVKYLLTGYTLNNKDKNARALHFEGSALFEELKGPASQQRRWQRTRQQVYEGSTMHFLRSALGNRMEDEGFRVLQITSQANPQKDKLPKILQTVMPTPLSMEEIIKPTTQDGIYAFSCDNDALHITYSKKRHFPKNPQLANLNDPDNSTTTIVNFNTTYALFDSNGSVINPNSLSFEGAWGNNRVAGLLPEDYEPPANDNADKKREILLNPIATVQQGPLRDSLLKITAAADSSIKNHSAEKIYLQFDKPYYAVGDTIWFKAWLLNAPTLGLSSKSGIIYADITNDSNRLIKQYRLPVKEGLCWGDISLKDFLPGNYTLRAYTNWMRNFGVEGFFYKQFSVSEDNEQAWMANEQVSTSTVNGLLKAKVKLRLSDINNKAVTNKDLPMEVMAGNHHLYKQQVQTDQNGLLDVNFTVPEKATTLSLVATDKKGGNKIVVPVELNRSYKTDIQFLPEGGNLVAGLPAHIGVKAIGEDGKGVNISGVVIDHNQQQVATFQTLQKGMGSFDLPIKPDESYTAKVNLPGGVVKEYPLPAVKNSGTALNVINPVGQDSVTISLAASGDLVQPGRNYFLIGKARGIICYAAILSFKDKDKISRKIAKRLFPSGITHFTLMTAGGQPLNERLVFIDHHDDLRIEMATDMPVYSPHDSVAVHLLVRDSSGAPVAGNFSLAVTDDAQVKIDSVGDDNILIRLLLTSDLKGYVEEPDYYFQKGSASWQALDNLLLTQGWVNYDWQVDKDHHVFAADEELTVKGQVLNTFNSPIKGTHITLLSKSPVLAKDTVTDKNGYFTFNNFPRIDTPAFLLSAVNRNGKSSNVGIKIDESVIPIFNTRYPIQIPWYINSDTTLLNYTKIRNIIDTQQDYIAGGHHLKEVKIVAKKTVKGSQNLNGPGNADLVFDEKDMEKAGKKTWLDIFQEKIKGFREGRFIGSTKSDIGFYLFLHDVIILDTKVPYGIEKIPTFSTPWYFIDDRSVKFLVDGISLGKINWYGAGFLDIQNYLKSHNAEDIKGIEVNSSTKYAAKYVPAQFAMSVSFSEVAFIEITTRSGHGPFLHNTPGTYLYKPLPVSYPQQFYKPHYTVNDTTKRQPDLRSTIDWEPNIITDADGKATMHFYTADKPSTYTMITEGVDFNGNLGYKRQKITIKKPKEIKSK